MPGGPHPTLSLPNRLSSVVCRPSVLVVLLTLPALWPLLRQGFFVSDDGLFHVYRIAALADAWSHGVLYPRLFPDFGFGYGQAVLNFYAPLTYVPGALLASLGVNPATAVEITIALGFVLAALAIYGSTRSLWGPVGGVMAAVAYTYFPYHLADAYLRGAVPEFFAFIWPPLILWATTDAFRKERPVGPLLWGALAWTGLIFTHNLTALMMIPVWIAYALLMAAWTRRWRRLLGAAGSLALALGLSAPLWLPFLVESRWVGISLGPSDGYKRHLAPLDLAVQWQPLYQYRVQHGGVADHPLSWLTVGLFLLVLGLFVYRFVRRQRVIAAPVVGFGLALMAASAFMITLPSLPLWEPLAPILANLQYPWRFLTLTALGFAMCLAALPSLLGAEPRRHGEHGGHEETQEISVPSVPQGGFALSPWFNGPFVLGLDSAGGRGDCAHPAAVDHHARPTPAVLGRRRLGARPHVARGCRGGAGGRDLDGRIHAADGDGAALGARPAARGRGRWAGAHAAARGAADAAWATIRPRWRSSRPHREHPPTSVPSAGVARLAGRPADRHASHRRAGAGDG